MFATLHDVSAALHAGRTSAAALVEEALAKAADLGVMLVLEGQARTAAREADKARAGGDRRPFLGVPITIKDNFDLAGLPTTAGSRLLAGAPAAEADAEAVRLLKAAGFVIIGRTHMTEFAFSGLGLNPHFGTPLNPRFPGERRIAGGSSSGAAVSVAGGLVPIALGTDTGGSVRIPAALCGLVGFKPTSASISKQGVLPLSTTLDSVGILAHCVDDCAVLFGKLAAPQPHAFPIASSTRLAVVDNYMFDGCDAAVEDAIALALARLEDVGFEIEHIRLPILDEIAGAMSGGTFPGAESFVWHEPFLGAGRQAEYDPRVLSRIEAGGQVEAAAYERLCRWRETFIAAFDEAASGYATLLWPTVPLIAPALASLANDEPYWRTNGLMLRNSMVTNLADGCAISLPCRYPQPVGLTLSAPRAADRRLLALAAAVESALN